MHQDGLFGQLCTTIGQLWVKKNNFLVWNLKLQCINHHFMAKKCLIFKLAQFDFSCQILDFSSEWRCLKLTGANTPIAPFLPKTLLNSCTCSKELKCLSDTTHQKCLDKTKSVKCLKIWFPRSDCLSTYKGKTVAWKLKNTLFHL